MSIQDKKTNHNNMQILKTNKCHKDHENQKNILIIYIRELFKTFFPKFLTAYFLITSL